jgi:aminoglycoside phosphotransferase (APT) family kinase protein
MTIAIDTALVRRLIARQFPHWSHLSVAPVQDGGNDNRTFRLGDRMSVRLPSSLQYAPQVEKEQRWLPWLGSRLPLPTPVPLGHGTPDAGYPSHWSIYAWIEGERAQAARIADASAFARDLAGFLAALQAVDATEGPPAGAHNFHRGGRLSVYGAEARRSIAELKGEVDAVAASEVMDLALASAWDRPPAWVHGDVSDGNLLVKDGRLCAVIDFGCAGVGDPACDLVIAWTFLDARSRGAFRDGVPLDAATWQRARGWALWKSLLVLGWKMKDDPAGAESMRHVIAEIIADHRSDERR